MDKYTDDDIKKIIAEEIDQSSGSSNDAIDAERQNALKYYLGDKGNTKAGRSAVVSTDVADSIEWILPEIVKAFTQNNEVVTFDPVGPNDSTQAQLESRFVYDVLMKHNNGFLAIHTLVKDALLQKNGFIKVYYNKTNRVAVESYIGITTPELQMILAEDDVELVGQTTSIDESGIEIHDVNIRRVELSGSVVVKPVAPENMRVYGRHNSIDMSECRFISETQSLTRSDLVESGYDRDEVYSVSVSDDIEADNRRTYRFEVQGESTYAQSSGKSVSPENELLDVTEAYMFLDLNDDGIAERVKITYIGDDEPVHILSVEEIDECPYISVTAIIMSHKFFGMSIYDRLKEIQDIKTALWRNMLDNMYLQNNQRTLALEGQVNLDDLLDARPGGVVRVTNLDAVRPFPTNQLSSDSYNMMSYMDQVRAGRVGVSPDGSISDSAMGDRVGSEGLGKLLTQKEELVGLMVRVFAETGIKPLCIRIRDLLISNKDVVEDYEFRGGWGKVNPSRWVARNSTTVRVGTGSGNRKEQAAALLQVLTFQSQILAQPGQAIVTEKNVFAALNDFIKSSGMPGAVPYFLDPDSPEGQENKQQVAASSQQAQEKEIKEQQALLEAQTTIAQAEQTKAQAAQESVLLKGKIERLKTALETIKGQSDNRIAELEQQLSEAQLQLKDVHHTEDLQFKYDQLQQQYEIAMAQLQSGEKDADARKD